MIGVITTSYPRHAGDPAGLFVATRVRQLLRAHPDEEVLIIAAGSDKTTTAPRLREIRIDSSLFTGAGAPEVLEAGGAWSSALAFSWRQLAAVRAHRHAVSAFESHWLVPSGLAVALAAPGLPHRAFVHSGDVALLERIPPALARAIVRTVRRHADEIVCASEDLRRRVVTLLAEDQPTPTVVTRAVPVDELFTHRTAAETMPRVKKTSRPRSLLAVGRLVPVKGFDVLVHAVGRIPVAHRPRVLILGEGPERGRLGRLAGACGVQLDLPGQVAGVAVAEAMLRADLCVIPSRRLGNGRSEGMPLVAREAVMLGRPVLASAVGGLPELAYTGAPIRLVRPDDPAALARAITA